jgi:hypothetical protein
VGYKTKKLTNGAGARYVTSGFGEPSPIYVESIGGG